MEHQRLPRRSASHGALRNNYTRHARPLHKPLRSVNENAALLPSPGALESMLRTTTETGDIGLFSIKPFPGSSNLGISRGGKRPFGTTGNFHPRPRHSVDETYGRNAHGRIPSYRDTTLEIISMYGSNSQSSVGSTLGLSTEEPNQRSYSMSTVGSRHIPPNKPSIVLQNQSSAAMLQRPRSPFPYPTRLKRPGARPASPAVTDTGIVDYSRMVEIDRISLRTGNGPSKSPYPHVLRNQPSLGLRSDAVLSNPSLPGRCPPLMRHPPATPSIRTASAASVASWNAPHRERLNSVSTRTSSLTSVINTYRHMPLVLRTAQSGPPAPPPRYYDYTEEFERTQSRSAASFQPLAPVPTRDPSIRCPLVLREGSEVQLAAALGVDPDSSFFDGESQQDDSQIFKEDEFFDHREEFDELENEERRLVKPPQIATEGQNTIDMSDSPISTRRQTRGSDVDLLPSQMCRVSMDTFRPSLDVESREVPLFSYPYRTRKVPTERISSPAQHVQVNRGRTLTIRSEQGVISKGEVQEGEFSSVENTCECDDASRQITTPTVLVESPTKWRSKSDSAHSSMKASRGADAGIGIRRRRTVSTEHATRGQHPDLDIQNPGEVRSSDNNESSDLLEILESPMARVSPQLSRTTSSLHSQLSCNSQGHAISTLSADDKSPKISIKVSCQQGRNRENQATLQITKKDLPRNDSEVNLPQESSSCTTPLLIAPMPISPARELKVKNSIPQLMKALPQTPGEAGYVFKPTTITMDDEVDDYAAPLLPYNLTRSETLQHPRASFVAKTSAESSRHSQNPLPELSKKPPNIRLKPKNSNPTTALAVQDSRPWDFNSNYPWCDRTTEIELGGMCDGMGSSRVSFKKRLRLSGSRPVCDGWPSLETVRHHPDARGSGIVADLARQQPKDLFKFSNSLSSMFRQVSRKLSHNSQDDVQAGTSDNTSASEPTRHCGNTIKSPHAILTRADEIGQFKVVSSEGHSSIKQHRRLRKSISNLRGRLRRSSHAQLHIPHMDVVSIAEGKDRIADSESTFKLDKNLTTKEEAIAADDQQRPQFKQRVRAIISKWARGTKAAMKNCGRRAYGVNITTRGESRSTV